MLLELVYTQGQRKLLEGSGTLWKAVEINRRSWKEMEDYGTLWKSLENARMFHR